METVFFFFRRALKFAIGRKTEQGINCPSPYFCMRTETKEVQIIGNHQWKVVIVTHIKSVDFLHFTGFFICFIIQITTLCV